MPPQMTKKLKCPHSNGDLIDFCRLCKSMWHTPTRLTNSQVFISFSFLIKYHKNISICHLLAPFPSSINPNPNPPLLHPALIFYLHHIPRQKLDTDLPKWQKTVTPYELRNTLISHTREAAQSYGNQGSKRICFSLKWGNLQS